MGVEFALLEASGLAGLAYTEETPALGSPQPSRKNLQLRWFVLRIVVATQESARHRGFRHKGSAESTARCHLGKRYWSLMGNNLGGVSGRYLPVSKGYCELAH